MASGNIDPSAPIAEAAHELRRQEALRAFLDEARVPVLSAAQLAEITAEWSRPRRRRRARSRRA